MLQKFLQGMGLGAIGVGFILIGVLIRPVFWPSPPPPTQVDAVLRQIECGGGSDKTAPGRRP